MTVGATVRNAAGEVGMVEALVVIDAPQVMYNLTIALVATYVVGSGQWVVHNNDRYDGYLFPDMPDPNRPLGVGSDNFYSVLFEVELIEGTHYPVAITSPRHETRIRRLHNRFANNQLKKVITDLLVHNPKQFEQFLKLFRPVVAHKNLIEAPPGWTVHHVPGRGGIGIVQVVPTSQHQYLSGKMHQQPGNIGGFAMWTNSNSPHYLGDEIVCKK